MTQQSPKRQRGEVEIVEVETSAIPKTEKRRSPSKTRTHGFTNSTMMIVPNTIIPQSQLKQKYHLSLQRKNLSSSPRKMHSMPNTRQLISKSKISEFKKTNFSRKSRKPLRVAKCRALQ